LADERQDAYSIGEHGEWVLLGHAFFAEDKDGLTVVALEHEYHPVFVAVEYKPGPERDSRTKLTHSYNNHTTIVLL
jgi:hypothetical protein